MADALVNAAIANWGPRFTANGVDPSDFSRITATIERWDDWCATWCVAAAEHEALGQSALADGHPRSAGEHLTRAAAYYHFAKFVFVDHPDEARRAHALAVGALDAALAHLDPPGRRHTVPFEGTGLAGVLRCPAGAGPHPTVVLVAGLDSAKEEFALVEQSFLDRGLATFAFDGPGQGEAEWHLAARPDWEVVGRAVIDHLGDLVEVDEDRIGVWGVSLGGYYAARMTSGEPRIRACASLCGPYDLGPVWDGLNPLTRRAFEVRAGCASTAEAAEAAAAWSLEGRAGGITVPLLVIVGKRDRLFSWQDGQRLVDEAGGPTRLVVLEEGNHGGANVIYRHRPFTADWMAGQLGA